MNGGQYRTHIVYPLGTISLADGKVGLYIGAFLSRLVSTGLKPTADPFIIAVGLHYKKNGLGSRTMYQK